MVIKHKPLFGNETLPAVKEIVKSESKEETKIEEESKEEEDYISKLKKKYKY